MQTLDIVNRALLFLGSHPADTMNDVAKNAARAISAYEKCRDEVLRMVPWTCCLKRELMKDTGEQATPWTASHTYGVGERVTNDTAKTYVCTDVGKSAAATGPTGTGTNITDGTVIWRYVEASTATVNWCHAVLTVYELGDLVSWDTGKVYMCTQAGTTAAANPPVGTGTDIIDGTVKWAYHTTIKANRTVYAYQYVLPPDCLRVIKVPLSTGPKESTQGVQHTVEGKFLYCDQEESFLRYVYRAEVSEWDSLLQGTVAFRIAAEIALDVTGQKDIQATAFQALSGQYASARAIAMGETQEGVPEVIRWEDV
jgi:hypothetical protein